MDTAERQPARLAALYQLWLAQTSQMYRTTPDLVFAVIGQARIYGKLSPELESEVLAKLLTPWALRATVNMSEICAAAPTVVAAAA